MSERILFVDDNPDFLQAWAAILEGTGYEFIEASSGEAAEQVLRTSSIDVVVVDLMMPGIGGLDVLGIAKETDPETIVILVTGFAKVETAVAAIKSGAADYLLKPFSPEQLLQAIESSVEKRRSQETHRFLKSQLRATFALGGMVGRSSLMLQLFDDIRKAAPVGANVLILGESGVGKELVARMIHEGSLRHDRSFFPLNCAAIPENLLEAELFGYERGAFTGADASKAGLLETADRGTLLLDEVCELSPPLQAKLLRALEEGSVRRVGGTKAIQFDVRFVASTNRDIHQELKNGGFREDLFFRLNVIQIQVPPLRERREDIPLLAAHFLEKFTTQYRKQIDGIGREAGELLTGYDWPGNVRELRNAVERAAAYAKGPLMVPADLPEMLRDGAGPREPRSFEDWRKTIERLEKQFLEESLARHGRNITRAAKALRMHRSTLHRLMRRHSIASCSLAVPPRRREQ